MIFEDETTDDAYDVLTMMKRCGAFGGNGKKIIKKMIRKFVEDD